MEGEINFNSDSTKQIDVNFDFLDPKPEFAQSVRSFIRSLFDHNCPIHQVAEHISNQVEIGTFLIADNGESPEDSVLGFISLVDLDSPACECVKSYLRSKGDIPQLTEKKCGLLLCERIINLPPQLIPHLHTQLVEDYNWTKSNYPDFRGYDYVISLSRTLSTMPSSTGRKKRKGVGAEGHLFFRVEDEILLRHSEESFLFENESGRMVHSGVSSNAPVNTEEDAASHKCVIVMPWTSYLAAEEEIRKFYSQTE